MNEPTHHGFSSGTWANILGMIVLAAGWIKNCQETATLVATQATVNTNQDLEIERMRKAVEAAKSTSVDMEILQRLTAVETKLDGALSAEKRKK